MIPRRSILVLALSWLLWANFAWAADGVYGTPEAAKADPDFALQGEYVGERVGMQVVALGEGEFSVVTYPGGLPGAGWTGTEKQIIDADREDLAGLVGGLKRTERASPTLGAKPPKSAVVLFDGTRASLDKHWRTGSRMTDDGLLMQGCTSTDRFRDFTLHLEFQTPFMPKARGQGRGNSGVYYQGRYETQVLDSFGLEGRDNECGGIYSVAAPTVNMCLPPLAWQTYDVEFTAARYDDQGQKTSPAKLTVKLNGVTVHQNVEVPGPTTAAPVKESPEPGPIYLQDHGNPVRYRNIWVVPRDSEQESRRPIVPGFERFYATAGVDQGAAGRLLVEELNCTACHQADAALAAGLLPRPAPSLENIGARVRPEYLLEFIKDPPAAKPGARMPAVLARLAPAERDGAARAIVNFLAAGSRLPEQPGNRKFAKNGERLFHTIGCTACHAPRNGQKVSPATTVTLPDLRAKTSIPALVDFLKNPQHFRPAGRMPSLNLNNDEARDLAHYLIGDVDVQPRVANLRFAAYEGAWEESPDFSKLTPIKTGQAAGFDLTVAGRENNFGVRFEGYLKIDREGAYRFHLGSDDGSLLWIDGKQVASSDGIHPHQFSSGVISLAQGMHPLRVDYFQGGGEWTLELEYEGPGVPRRPADLSIYLTETTPPPLPPATEDDKRFVLDPSQIDRGRELFAAVGCASCHELKRDGQPIKSAVAARPLRQCSPEKGCLGGPDLSRAPDFALSVAQREALASALSAPPPAEPSGPEEKISHTMTAFNCYACHSRGGVGGPEADRNPLFATTIPEMGDEGRVPPPLDGVGDKLQPGWLKHVLAEGAKDRPYMLARMPKFGSAAVAALAEAFVAADQKTEAKIPALAESELHVKSTGRALVGDKALSCIKCHAFGQHRAIGIQAIGLDTMTRRVREDWFHRYLANPPQFRPGTRMPTGFAGGRSTIGGVYGGDPPSQIAAIWTYLTDGDKAGIPDGLIAGVLELKPENRPIIYRNFIDGLSPRGIAVGYPEGADLAWDANRLCLSLIWHGRFIDASMHWTGRGNGFQSPLGDHIVRLEDTAPLAKLESLDAAWPGSPPKERGYQFRGYRLDRAGRPTFQYSGPGFAVEDQPLPKRGDKETGFERRLTIRAEQLAPGLYLLAGASSSIEPLGEGRYKVGAVHVRVRGAGVSPFVRTSGGRQELLVPVMLKDGQAEIVQEIFW
ncbi:MAG TPA: family 16 glycoside hydrolase [Pirellulales bacterium]|nr:family 16 glycoside hydrolase [Pirellulales bacterium]